MHQRALLMGWFHSESAKKKLLQKEALGLKTNSKKKKENVFRDRREMSHFGIFFLIAASSLSRHVEVSGWITAMQEFMSVIFRGAIRASQSNSLNKTDFPLEVSKAFIGFDLKLIT